MDIRQEIAYLIVKDKNISDNRLKMILNEIKNSNSEDVKLFNEKILSSACVDRINNNQAGLFLKDIKNLLIQLNCKMSVQRAGQILSLNGIKKTNKLGTSEMGYYLK